MFRLIERVVRPKESLGVDWSRPIIVLAQVGKKELWWLRGVTLSYSSICKEYIPARLVLVEDAEEEWRGRRHTARDVCEGGRLSRKRFAHHAEVIDQFFGLPGLTKALHPQKTLVLATTELV